MIFLENNIGAFLFRASSKVKILWDAFCQQQSATSNEPAVVKKQGLYLSSDCNQGTKQTNISTELKMLCYVFFAKKSQYLLWSILQFLQKKRKRYKWLFLGPKIKLLQCSCRMLFRSTPQSSITFYCITKSLLVSNTQLFDVFQLIILSKYVKNIRFYRFLIDSLNYSLINGC